MDVTMVLPHCRVGCIEQRQETGWLIESLWLREAAGLIGGQPKTCKSWLGLDAAVSVASGTPCLGCFEVKAVGPTLVYLAEDSVDEVRARVEGICRSRGLDIMKLDLTVITAAALRLDSEGDQERLRRIAESLKPRLVLLDPLVRLHRLDENNSRDIAGILGYLRELQRQCHTAVILTHHANKRANTRPGQGLRGSSDLHAFGDSNLYLAKNGEDLELTIEHRSAAAIDPIQLTLRTGNAVHLAVTTRAPKAGRPPVDQIEERIIAHLANRTAPMPRQQLRDELKVNNQRYGQAITALIAMGRITATPTGIMRT